MSTLIAKIDRFVRWFFNVSPTSMAIEPQPQRRRARTAKRSVRPASSKERREPRSTRKATVSQSDKKEGT
jgi:hypothetical protein